MALVRKCDVCGGVYEKYHERTIVDLYISRGGEKGRVEYAGMYTDIDNCCPECTTKILNFVNTMKNTKRLCL